MIRAVRRIFGFIGRLMLAVIVTIFALIMTLGAVGFGLGLCVESVAYLSHATPVVTFVPTGTEENCTDSGCGTLIEGYLLPGHEAAHTQTAFRIGEPVTVRAPILGKIDPDLITTDGGAVGFFITGIISLLIGITVGMLLLYPIVIDKWDDVLYPVYYG